MLYLPNLLIAIVILVFAFRWFLNKKSEAQFNALLKESDTGIFQPPFRSVVIDANDGACQEVLKLRSKVILLNEAPVLPLASCNLETCDCKFMRYDDRRQGFDRREKEVLDDKRALAYADKRLIKDRRRASIQQFLTPRYRTS